MISGRGRAPLTCSRACCTLRMRQQWLRVRGERLVVDRDALAEDVERAQAHAKDMGLA